MAPAVYGVDQRPVGELPILIELVERIAGQDSLDRLPEDFPHVQIDAAHGPVVIDVVVEVEAGVEEEKQGLGAVLMKQQALPIEKRVVEKPLQVDRTHFDA